MIINSSTKKMISETQKQIYNLYLRSLAEGSDRPYRVRKNFDKLKDEYKVELEKLEKFFLKFPHLFRYEFFQAPYKIYQDENKFYSLKFYSGKGLQTCLAYFKNLKESEPDEQLDYIKESLKFIANFCVEKNIRLDQYIGYKSVAQNDFLLHLKQHKISFYAIFAIPGVYYHLLNIPDDEFGLYFGDDLDLDGMWNRFNGSKKAKSYLEENVPKIEEWIRNNLKLVA